MEWLSLSPPTISLTERNVPGIHNQKERTRKQRSLANPMNCYDRNSKKEGVALNTNETKTKFLLTKSMRIRNAEHTLGLTHCSAPLH
jgi:hypothetical protein